MTDDAEDLAALTFEQLVSELETTIDRMAGGSLGIEEVTDDLCAGLEIDLDTQLCLRVYYRGRRRLKTLGWNAVLEQSSSASTVE